MRAVAFVPVRLSSSRLPKKHLRFIGDRPLLDWVLYRLYECEELDDIVVCMPDEPLDDAIVDICEKYEAKIFIYKGDPEDVVGRLVSAAKKYEADICVLASGDCPLLNSKSIDRLIRTIKLDPSIDYVTFGSKDGKEPIHEGVFVSKRHVWERADEVSKDPHLREHQFPVLWMYKDTLFSDIKHVQVVDEDIFYKVKHRISVDTPSDLEFMNLLFNELKSRGKDFNLENVVRLIVEKPELLEVNKSVRQKSVGEKTERILIILHEGANVKKALTLAKDLTNSGLGVKFIVFDEKVKKLLSRHHFEAEVLDRSVLLSSAILEITDGDNAFFLKKEEKVKLDDVLHRLKSLLND